MASKTNPPSTDFILETTRTIQAWQRSRIDAVQSIFEKTLENLTSNADINLNSLPKDLDKLLFKDLNLPMNHTSRSSTTVNRIEENDESESSSTHDFPNQSQQQLPIESSATSRKDQAIKIKQKPNVSHPCFSDKSNGVMAFNGDELVYIDWIMKGGKSPGKYEVRIIETKTPNHPNGNDSEDNCRSLICPHEFKNALVVDMDYAPHMSKYVIAIVERPRQNEKPTQNRKSFVYLFDSTDDTFQEYESACNAIDRRGLITRLCCCSNQPIVYLIMNNFSESDLIILKGDGTLYDQKTSEDLPLPRLDARLVDIACTANNDRVALTFNTSTHRSSGQTGVCVINPQNWTRIGLINLKETNIPFILPRLTWIENQALFALIDQDGKLMLFDPDAKTIGTRNFLCPVRGQEEHLYPTNVCASQSQWIAIRYERVITIHQLLN